jgi:hypothetical protein
VSAYSVAKFECFLDKVFNTVTLVNVLFLLLFTKKKIGCSMVAISLVFRTR